MLQSVKVKSRVATRHERSVTSDSFLEHKVIKTALQSIGKRQEYKEIVLMWPNIESACLKLATYTSDLLPAPDGSPLINLCLMDAITAYEDSAGQEDSRRILAFMTGIINHSPSFLNCRIYCKASQRSQSRAWEAFAEPFVYWLRKKRCESVIIESHSDSNGHLVDKCLAKNMLFARLFNMRDAAMAGDVSSVLACARNDDCQCMAGEAQG